LARNTQTSHGNFSRNRRLQFALDPRRGAKSNKAVTQMTDPEYKVEFDGKEIYVMCDGVKLATRRDDCWMSIEPGVTVRDIVENGRHGIEVEYRRVTVH
jgi:hypothetical protein